MIIPFVLLGFPPRWCSNNPTSHRTHPDLITSTLICAADSNWRTMLMLGCRDTRGAGELALHETLPGQRLSASFNPQADPLGSGYHIIQSEIAIGAAGPIGKGFLKGTQARLNFLPEQSTDFIFAFRRGVRTRGAIVLLTLYASIIARGA